MKKMALESSVEGPAMSLSDPAGPWDGYILGFDWLRAFAALAVVALHTGLLGKPALFKAPLADLGYAKVLADITVLYIFMLAVPLFYLMSFYLFFNKILTTKNYVAKRMPRLLKLYLAWTGIWLAFYGGLRGAGVIVPHGPLDLLAKMASGWNSLYYFFFSLLLLTVLGIPIRNLRQGTLGVMLFLSVAFLAAAPYIVFQTGTLNFLVAHWDPLNFLPYLLIAAMLSRYFSLLTKGRMARDSLSISGLLLIIFVILVLIEWHFMVSHEGSLDVGGYPIPPYTRPSIVVGATALFLLSFSVRRAPGSVITFLARYSLGLYCLHGFFNLLFNHFFISSTDIVNRVVIYAGTLAASLVMAMLACRYTSLVCSRR